MRVTPVSIAAALMLMLPAPAQSARDDLHRLFAEHFEYRLREYPEFAMELGDYRYADRITDNSLAAIERRHAETQAFLDRVRAIDRSALPEQEVVNLELFELELANAVEEHRFRTYLMPVGHYSGPQRSIPQMGERVRFDTVEHYEQYLSRLRQVPRSLENTMEAMRLGMREGLTPPRVSMRTLPMQVEAILRTGIDRLGVPFEKFPASVPAETGAALKRRFEQEVRPALVDVFTRFRDFLREEYLPGCVESIAAVDLPDGEAFYNFQLRQYTTTDLTARQIHDLGLKEVARIRAEMMEVIRSSDFMERDEAKAVVDDEQALFRAFLHYLRTDPRFYHTTPEGLIAEYRDICKRMDAQLPRLFRRLPRLPYGVKEMPAFMAPTQTTAFYQPGDIRNAEPGWFVANTYALDQRPRYEMQALAFHEAVPGHHLQIALAKELEDLPDFRKEAYFVAFGEGWALYSERLGLEVGFYEDPYDNFGRLIYEMWRACRLVVDPGMHALRWSREQAVRFMLDNTALSELNINNEIDRYIAWPGQACGYKIGEIRIRQLRAEAEKALGGRFDVRAFHDVVLGAGTVPLSVLERRVKAWIASGGP